MTRLLKKITMLGIGFMILASFALPSVFAKQYVGVSLPTFTITMNNVGINNNEREYPIIVFKDITYVPMTYNDSRFLGLETKWDNDTGLQVNKISEQTAYNPNRGSFNSNLENAELPEFQIRVNGKTIYNNSETYPLLVFRDITYFPLTWRFMVNEFGWTSSFDATNGLVISSKGGSPGSTTPPERDRMFSKDFGNTTILLDRSSNNQPGNLYVKENNRTRKVGNPNYIYGVGYVQSGRYGEYSAIDTIEFANRWVHTLAIDPNASTIMSKNVRINIDTNEVQTVDGSSINDPGNLGNQVYSRQFGNITVILDRASNRQSGNLYVRINNNTRKIGNPNYIYGVSYTRQGSSETYNPVDNINLSNRWVHTLAIDPNAQTIMSRNVRVNIDTNEVQLLDEGSNIEGNPSNQIYSRQFGNITVILDRASNRQPGNLYVRINNSTKKIGNPNYIYGVSYTRLAIFETYNPVDNVNLSGRWVQTLAIDPSAQTITSKNVRVNIDTNEVQIIN